MSAPDIDQLKRRFEEVFGRPPRDFSESKPTFVETINTMSFINKLNTLERKINIIDTHISLMQEFIKDGSEELAKKIIQKDKFVETMIQIKIVCQSIINDNEDDITRDLFKIFQRFFSLYDTWRNKYKNGDFTMLPTCITPSKKGTGCSIMGGKTRRKRTKGGKTKGGKTRAGKRRNKSTKRNSHKRRVTKRRRR